MSQEKTYEQTRQQLDAAIQEWHAGKTSDARDEELKAIILDGFRELREADLTIDDDVPF